MESAPLSSTAESVRLNFARIRKGDWKGWYEGPQGMLLADLLNFAGRYDGDDGVNNYNNKNYNNKYKKIKKTI